MNVPNFCMSKKNKYYAFLNVLKFEEYIVYVKVWIWYDEDVELSIYHLTLQNFYLILW